MKHRKISHQITFICCLILSMLAPTAHAQYCTPGFFEGCSFFGLITGDDINTFTLTGVASTSINDLETGCSGGYDDRTAESITFNPGSTYNGTINSTDDLSGDGESMQIYIDFSNDGTFDASESVGGIGIAGIAIDPSTSPFTITIPAGVASGTYRMRVILCSQDDAIYPGIDPCASIYDYGEVHDYTAIIGTATPTCGIPTSFTAGSVTSTSAILNWLDPSGSVGSEYVVSTTSGTPTGSGTATTALTYSASGLTPSTVYYAYVRDSCGPGNISAWVATTFTTTATVATTCNPVTGLAASAITGTTATISWAAVTGSVGYIYIVDNTVTAPAGPGTFTTATSVPLTGLTAGTTYYAHVRDSCGPGNESGWVTVPFTTITTTGCNAGTGLTAGSITAHTAIISWTPATGAAGAEYVTNMIAADPTTSGTRTSATTYTATLLTQATLYYAHVRDSCSAASKSAWVTIPFTTLPGTGLGVGNMAANDFSITAFPNPIKDEVTVRINGATGTTGQVMLFDISGKLIKTATAYTNTLTFSMNGLASGIYFIRYIDAENTQTIKVFKE